MNNSTPDSLAALATATGFTESHIVSCSRADVTRLCSEKRVGVFEFDRILKEVRAARKAADICDAGTDWSDRPPDTLRELSCASGHSQPAITSWSRARVVELCAQQVRGATAKQQQQQQQHGMCQGMGLCPSPLPPPSPPPHSPPPRPL
jgi:hypothetical protein